MVLIPSGLAAQGPSKRMRIRRAVQGRLPAPVLSHTSHLIWLAPRENIWGSLGPDFVCQPGCACTHIGMPEPRRPASALRCRPNYLTACCCVLTVIG